MATKIRGITVEIGGDTSGLNKALTNVNKEIRSTQSQLKDVEKLLKLDPKNTELLAQKQKLLGQAIGESKTKLEALKKAQADMDANKVDKNSKAYDALRREIIATEQELKKLESSADQAGQKLQAAADKFKKAGEGLTNAGKAMLPVTAAITGAGAAAVKTTATYESAMSQVQATMGITKDSMSQVNGESVNTMEALQNLAKEMGANTAFSATECAEALNYLALAGYSTQQMTDTLPIVLNLAAAGGIDLASASDMVTDAMSALGMETSEAGKMVDQMAKTASTTNTSVAQLGEGILTIGATAKQMKGGTAELNTALGILANNGIKASEGGTHLRNVILALQTPTDKAADLMGQLGLSTYDSEGKMRSLNDILGDLNTSMADMTDAEKADVIGTIFNKTDLAAVNSLLANTGSAWEGLQGSIEASSGSAQQMADTQLDNLNGQITLLKSQLEGLAIQIGETLMPIVKGLVDRISGVVTWFSNLDEGAQKTILVILGIVAAIGPLLIFIGQISTGISAIMTILPALSTAIGVLNAVLAANPIILIIIAVVALIAILVTLYNKCEWFRDGVNAVFEAIKNFLKDAWEFWKGVFQSVLDLFGKVLGFIKENWQGLLMLIVNPFGGAFKLLYDNCEGFKNFIDDFVQKIISFFTELPEKAITWGKDMIQGFIDGIKEMASKITEAVSGVAEKIKSFLHFSRPDEGPLRDYEKWMPDFMTGMAQGIKDNTYKVADAVRNAADAMQLSMGDQIANANVSGNTTVNNTTKVYLGNKELTGALTNGVVRKITHDQSVSNISKGGPAIV